MKEIKETKKVKNVANNDVPIATIVINEYKSINNRLTETNEHLQKSNKRMSIIALILLVLFAIEPTYIILYWEAMHPESGVIQEKRNK